MTVPRELSSVQRILAEFRLLDPELPIQVALLFVLVSLHEGASPTTLEKRLRISRSSISRGAARLSRYGFGSKPGLGLIEMREDPMDRRYKRLFLTEAGRRLADKLAQLDSPPADSCAC